MIETRLGDFEEVLLLITGILEKDDAYAFKIAEEFQRQTGREISIGAIHSTLDRLENKGFVKSEMGQATATRGGRRKRIFTITAILTLSQVRDVAAALNPAVPSVVSVFAGRIADTGRDPMPLMRASKALLESQPKAELLWASVREVLNIMQADEAGCQIVTVPHDILNKAAKLLDMDLTALSLDTVKMFAKDAGDAGYKL